MIHGALKFDMMLDLRVESKYGAPEGRVSITGDRELAPWAAGGAPVAVDVGG